MPSAEHASQTLTALLRETDVSAEARYHHRLHAVILVIQGRSCPEVAQWLGEAPRTVQRWVSRFRSKGAEGLQDESRTGRPSSLDDRRRARLAKDLARGPRAFGFEARAWDSELLKQHLELRYGILLGIRQCQRILKALNSGSEGKE